MSISLWFIIITFLVLMFAGVPVAFSLGVPCILWGLVVRGGIPITFVAQNIMGYMLSFTLISMPGFLLVGRLMNTCGVTDKLFKFAIAMVGRWRGGLAHANALASMMFASMSGTAVGDAGGLGLVEMKMMKEAGYDPYFAAGITASSSVLGPIIPPSSIMIMLGAVGEVSVASLFYGGIMPGVLMTAALMLNIALRAIFTKEGRTWPKTVIPWKEALKTIPQALPALGTFVIIIGSINGGVCTPTEAAILAVWYALILGICYRKVTFKNFWETLCQTIDACGTFMLIAATASILAWAFTIEGVPMMLRASLGGLMEQYGQTGLLLVCGVIFLILGCFLDTGAAALLTAPILMPVMKALGISLVHFGLIMVVGLLIGIITPPFGLCLFVVANVNNLTVKGVTKEALRYLPAMVIVLILIIIFPEIVLWLPRISGLSIN